MKSKLAHTIGNTLAYVQDTIDSIATWGFSKLENVDSQKPKENEHKLMRYARSAAGFLGEVGHQYYAKYDEIKSHKGSDKSAQK